MTVDVRMSSGQWCEIVMKTANSKTQMKAYKFQKYPSNTIARRSQVAIIGTYLYLYLDGVLQFYMFLQNVIPLVPFAAYRALELRFRMQRRLLVTREAT